MEKNNNELKSKVKRVFINFAAKFKSDANFFFGNCFHFYEWRFRNHVE